MISALDTRSNTEVAIKRVKGYARDPWFAKHTLREVKLLRLMDVHPNVISLRDLWVRESAEDLAYGEVDDSELYISMELMDTSLHSIIKSRQALSLEHQQSLVTQLLLGVQAMHKCGVLHRDLKPENLLVTSDCQLRITDLGLARSMENQATGGRTGPAMTEYVVTRWYRAPELLLATERVAYDGAVDLWSVGCIFAELVTGRALVPGKSYVHQIVLILDLLGSPRPTETGWEGEAALKFLAKQPYRPPKPVSRVLGQGLTSPAGRSFLEGLCRWLVG